MAKKKIRERFGKTIVEMAKKSARLEANTACAFLGYQSKEPESVKKLRKF